MPLEQVVTDGTGFAHHFVVHCVGISLLLSSEVWEKTQPGIRGNEKKDVFPTDTERTTYRFIETWWKIAEPEGKDEPSKDTVNEDNLFIVSPFCCQVFSI